MSLGKIIAVIFIFLATSAAWMVLGTVNQVRTNNLYSRLSEGGGQSASGEPRSGVQDLWGQPQTQSAPRISTTKTVKSFKLDSKGKRVPTELQYKEYAVPSMSRINVSLDLEPRRKGLLWYSTYKVDFSGDYKFINDFADTRTFAVNIGLPASQAIYHNVDMNVNGKPVQPPADLANGMRGSVELAPGKSAVVHISYATQGLDTWKYQFSQDDSVSSVRDFEAVIKTNTREIDFPKGAISPTDKMVNGAGWTLKWISGNMIAAGSNIGIAMPQKMNPGPLASNLSFFAPVSLLFFFSVLLILSAVKDIKLHPVHYLFISAGFFAFHLLFSYLVDHVTPFPSFLISSVVSLVLVISYMRLVVDWKFAMTHAALWQFVFLVLFAYAFFFEGYTGLTITIGAIITLGILMQLTGRVDWDEKLRSKPQSNPPPPPPLLPPGA